MEEDGLEELFGAARRSPPAVPAELLRRITADAEAELHLGRSRPSAPVHPATGWSLPVWLRSMPRVGAAAGLLTATLAGFWIGFVQPQPISDYTLSIGEAFGLSEEVEQVDLLSSLDPFSFEG